MSIIDWQANSDRVAAHLQHCVTEKKRLQAENERLRQALTDICAPMQYALRGYSEEERRHVNSILLVRLCDSIGFIQEIARKALSREEERR